MEINFEKILSNAVKNSENMISFIAWINSNEINADIDIIISNSVISNKNPYDITERIVNLIKEHLKLEF